MTKVVKIIALKEIPYVRFKDVFKENVKRTCHSEPRYFGLHIM